jgi:hypothetical protein
MKENKIFTENKIFFDEEIFSNFTLNGEIEIPIKNIPENFLEKYLEDKKISVLEEEYNIEIFFDDNLKNKIDDSNNKDIIKKVHFFLIQYNSQLKTFYNFLENKDIFLVV